jgi:hypothetical protein
MRCIIGRLLTHHHITIEIKIAEAAIERRIQRLKRRQRLLCETPPLFFGVLFLCLSRACLGKMFAFIYKWLIYI